MTHLLSSYRWVIDDLIKSILRVVYKEENYQEDGEHGQYGVNPQVKDGQTED